MLTAIVVTIGLTGTDARAASPAVLQGPVALPCSAGSVGAPGPIAVHGPYPATQFGAPPAPTCVPTKAPMLRSERPVCIRSIVTNAWLGEFEGPYKNWYDVALTDQSLATTFLLRDFGTYAQFQSVDTGRFLDWDQWSRVDTAWSEGADTHWTFVPRYNGSVGLMNVAGQSALSISWWGEVVTAHPSSYAAQWEIVEGPCGPAVALDADGDGFEGFLGDGSDCDDENPQVNPGALEIGGNGIDDDCRNGDGLGELGEPVILGVGTTEIVIGWEFAPGGTDQVSNGVVVFRSDNGEEIALVEDIGEPFFQIVGLDPNTAYVFIVFANDVDSASQRDFVVTTLPDPVNPDPPIDPCFAAGDCLSPFVGQTEAELLVIEWEPVVGDDVRYEVSVVDTEMGRTIYRERGIDQPFAAIFDLRPNTTYEISVSVLTGDIGYTTSLLATTAPEPPCDFANPCLFPRVSDINGNGFLVEWDPVVGTPPVTNYLVVAQTADGQFGYDSGELAPGQTAYLFDTLPENTTYDVFVLAFGDTWSYGADPLVVTTPEIQIL